MQVPSTLKHMIQGASAHGGSGSALSDVHRMAGSSRASPAGSHYALQPGAGIEVRLAHANVCERVCARAGLGLRADMHSCVLSRV